MGRVTHRVARKAETDHVVDRVSIVGHTHIGQPGRQVGAPLPTEPVLGCPDHGGVVPRLTERPNQTVRDDQMATLGEQGM